MKVSTLQVNIKLVFLCEALFNFEFERIQSALEAIYQNIQSYILILFVLPTLKTIPTKATSKQIRLTNLLISNNHKPSLR